MKTMLKTTLLTLIMAIGLAAPAAAQSRIATIDLRKLFEGFWKTKESTKALQDTKEEMDKDHKGLLDTFNKVGEDYKKLLSGANDPAVSSEEREKRKKSAEDKLMELKQLEDNIKQFVAQASENLEIKNRRLRDQVLKEIREVVTTTARNDTYDLVLDVAANSINGTPVVVFSTGANDLTQKVLTKLNADAPDDLPKTDDKKDDEKKSGTKK